MITFLELENFKSFKYIFIDLRDSKGDPKKLAFIYGENGVGKTNIMESVVFLKQTFETLNFHKFSKDIMDNIESLGEGEDVKRNILLQLVQQQNISLGKLFEENKRIGTTAPMAINIGFKLDTFDGNYKIVIQNGKIIEEELYSLLNKRSGVVFKISKDSVFLSRAIFSQDYISELKNIISKFWGSHTLFSILADELNIKNLEYLKEHVNNRIWMILDSLRRISMMRLFEGRYLIEGNSSIPFPGNLFGGALPKEQAPLFKPWELAIKRVLGGLYSDIEDVFYEIQERGDSIDYRLMVKKVVDGDVLTIPMIQESAGTRKIVNLLPLLLSAIRGGIVCIDEIDSSIHDLMMASIIENLDEHMEGQCIATTHNTILMETLAPKYVYIISVDSEGEKQVISVDSYKQRTQKNHNMRIRYLRGDYAGIPYTGYVDFEDIAEELNKNCWQSLNRGDVADGETANTKTK